MHHQNQRAALKMSGKRSASDAVGEVDSVETSKRLRSAVDESLTHLVCAITQELPLDPVTAEDGNVSAPCDAPCTMQCTMHCTMQCTAPRTVHRDAM